MGNKDSKPSGGVLTEAQIRLLEHNTSMSRDEIEAWHRQFLGEYPNGSIDEREFTSIFKRTFAHGNPEKYAKIAFKAFDSDKSGRISFEEFIMATSFANHGHPNRDKSIEFAFDVYDSDNNGRISKKEMDQMIAAIYELSGRSPHEAKERVLEIFRRFDLDHNGSLDKREFINFILSDSVCSQVFNI